MNEQDLPAGRELDVLVAEKVMGFEWLMNGNLKEPSRTALCSPEEACVARQRGWVRSTVSERYTDWGEDLVPRYSTAIASAWQLVEALHVRGECLSLTWLATLDGEAWGLRWQAEFRMTGSFAIARTAAEAICRAALIAAGRLEVPVASAGGEP